MVLFADSAAMLLDDERLGGMLRLARDMAESVAFRQDSFPLINPLGSP